MLMDMYVVDFLSGSKFNFAIIKIMFQDDPIISGCTVTTKKETAQGDACGVYIWPYNQDWHQAMIGGASFLV